MVIYSLFPSIFLMTCTIAHRKKRHDNITLIVQCIEPLQSILTQRIIILITKPPSTTKSRWIRVRLNVEGNVRMLVILLLCSSALITVAVKIVRLFIRFSCLHILYISFSVCLFFSGFLLLLPCSHQNTHHIHIITTVHKLLCAQTFYSLVFGFIQFTHSLNNTLDYTKCLRELLLSNYLFCIATWLLCVLRSFTNSQQHRIIIFSRKKHASFTTTGVTE